MATSTREPGPSGGGAAPGPTALGGAGAAAPPERVEVSGLHDIRQLAATTIERQVLKQGEAGGTTTALPAATSPLALGHVVLPVPGREVESPVAVAPAAELGGGRKRGVLFGGAALALVCVAVALAATGVIGRRKEPRHARQSTGARSVQGVASPRQVMVGPSEAAAAARAIARDGGLAGGEGVASVTAATGAGEVAAGRHKEVADSAQGGTGGGSASAGAPGGKLSAGKVSETGSAPATAGGGAGAAAKAAEPAKTEGKDVAPAKTREPTIEDILGGTIARAPQDKATEAKPAAPGEDLPTKLSPEDVKKGMGSIKARVQDCYDKYKVAGTISIRVKIDGDGTVASSSVVDSKFAGTETGTCVESAVRLARFPKFSGPSMSVNYPFRLQ